MKRRSSELELTRRGFLGGVGALAAGALLPRFLHADTLGARRLVVVILRGALDGLTAVPPHGDPDYAALRADLALSPPGQSDGALALDDTFALHPALAFLHERHLGGELIVFDAIASPYRERSHFDGQNVLESGLSRPFGSADGWLNRALASLPRRRPQGAMALGLNLPLLLRGPAAVLAKSPQAMPEIDPDLLQRLATLYAADTALSARLREAVESRRLSDAAPPPGNSAPLERLTAAAQMAAAVMRTPEGPAVAVLESTGWDTHANQGAAQGALAQRLAGLDRALRALAAGLGDAWPLTAVLVVTEFGRTVAINATRGTEHGTGGCP